MSSETGILFNRLRTNRIEMTRRPRSRSLTTMPNLREIAVDSSLVMLAFLNTNNAQHNRIQFGEPLNSTFKDDRIPQPLLNLLCYMNEEGVDIPDVFRRPGNAAEQKKLIKKLTEGKPVKFEEYNFYTLASVIKRFLLCIPGGILGQELEAQALTVLYLENLTQQLKTLNHIVTRLSKSVQHLLALLFGLWYRIAQREHIHQMSAEAMAKSVTGSIFVNTTSDPRLVKNAAKVMELIIENFTSPLLFGEENLQYFCKITSLSDLYDDMCYSKANVNHSSIQGSTSLPSSDAISLQKSAERMISLATFDDIRMRQLDRLKQRSEWFLSSHRSAGSSPRGVKHRNLTRGYISRKTIEVLPCHQLSNETDSSETSSSSSSDIGEDNT